MVKSRVLVREGQVSSQGRLLAAARNRAEEAPAHQPVLHAPPAHSLVVVAQEEAVLLLVGSPPGPSQEEAAPISWRKVKCRAQVAAAAVVEFPTKPVRVKSRVLAAAAAEVVELTSWRMAKCRILAAAVVVEFPTKLVRVKSRVLAAVAAVVALPTKLARVKSKVPLGSKGFDEVMSFR